MLLKIMFPRLFGIWNYQSKSHMKLNILSISICRNILWYWGHNMKHFEVVLSFHKLNCCITSRPIIKHASVFCYKFMLILSFLKKIKKRFIVSNYTFAKLVPSQIKFPRFIKLRTLASKKWMWLGKIKAPIQKFEVSTLEASL